MKFYRDNNYENSQTTNDTQIADIGIDKLMRCISKLFNETKANIISADFTPSLIPAPSQCEDIDTNEPPLPHQQEEISSPQNMPLDINNPKPQQTQQPQQQQQYKKLQKSNGFRPLNSKICKFWEQGDCRFGNDCRYLHTTSFCRKLFNPYCSIHCSWYHS